MQVLVTGHVPPGVAAEGGKTWFYQHFNTRMVHILQQYSDVIIGLHFGHEHADTFRIFYGHSGIYQYMLSITVITSCFNCTIGTPHLNLKRKKMTLLRYH